MDNELKFYLLAEKSGWDCSAYAFRYRETLAHCKAYQILLENTHEAKRHLSQKAKDIVTAFETTKIEPKTLTDTFVLETKINYLALHSFPEFYLNPLAIDPNYQGEVTTIGQLRFEINGKDIPLNDIILDETIPEEDKKAAIRGQVDEYLSDMNHLVEESLSIIKKRAFAKEKDSPSKLVFRTIVDCFLVFLINFLLFFSYAFDFTYYRECFFNPQANYLLTYLSYIFPIVVLSYDVIYAMFHSYKSQLSEPYNYARRFLKSKSQMIYDDIKAQSDHLYDYLCGAIKEKIVLKEDIRDFSKLSSTYIDFKKVLHVSDLLKRKDYRILSILNNIIKTIAILLSVVTILCCFLSMLFQSKF